MSLTPNQPQHPSHGGSRTCISERTTLIIMDCFETVLTMEKRSYIPRNGIREFLSYFRDLDRFIVIHSDASNDIVSQALEQAGLSEAFDAIYDIAHAGESLDADTSLKCLATPMQDFAVNPEQSIFIGDTPMDALSAHNYGVPFIRVPRSEDRDFSFMQLTHGPSRYSSETFERVLDDYYNEK